MSLHFEILYKYLATGCSNFFYFLFLIPIYLKFKLPEHIWFSYFLLYFQLTYSVFKTFKIFSWDMFNIPNIHITFRALSYFLISKLLLFFRPSFNFAPYCFLNTIPFLSATPAFMSSVHILIALEFFFYLFQVYLCFHLLGFVTLLYSIQILVFLKVFLFLRWLVFSERNLPIILFRIKCQLQMRMEFGMLQFQKFLYSHILWSILYITVPLAAMLGTLMCESFLVQHNKENTFRLLIGGKRCSPVLKERKIWEDIIVQISF